ncbi:JAB domain-containing protein [Weeksellaceae bacterium A-14]
MENTNPKNFSSRYEEEMDATRSGFSLEDAVDDVHFKKNIRETDGKISNMDIKNQSNGKNTNYGFEEDEATRYLKTSEGEILPYKLFSAGNHSGGESHLLRENDSHRDTTDFALVERQFAENKTLSFTAGTKISEVSDVAWLFRSLEDEAVEHTFALYRFKDDSYLVQHLSSGGITATVVDLRLLAGNVFKLNPESITLVHNHPSGRLVSSREDRLMLDRLNKIFADTGINVEDGIILNLRSGKYLTFTAESITDVVHELKNQNQFQNQFPVNVYSFSKQVFAENYQPKRINGPEDIAAYLSSQKFGLSDKTEALILNNANEIVGKFVLPQHRPLEKLTELLTIHAGTATILYGNNITDEMFNSYKDKLALSGFTALDAIRLKSNNYYSVSQEVEIQVNERLLKNFSNENKDNLNQMNEKPANYQFNNTKDSNNINNQNPNIMETQKEFNQVDYLKNQLKYLGFGENSTLHKDLEKGIKSKNQEFEIKTSSDKALPGNKVDFNLKFNKTESGGVFLNAYHAKLTKENGEEISHNFPVNRENTFTAKEAVNLLEGRSVKIEFHNPKSDQSETAFVQFNFEEPKTDKGNYMFQNFYQNYGVDTEKIVEKSNLIFDKPEYKENTIKSLEKGNVVKVKFEMDDKVVEGKAVLNPQYKNLNLYDSQMNRMNTNKPLQGMENEEKNEKANVREQSIKR